MSRVWRRAAAAAFSAFLVVGLMQCKGKPQPGGSCTSNGKQICADSANSLVCQNNLIVAVPCRGPKGCVTAAGAGECDDDLAQEGDGCVATLNENYACSTDHKKELVCKNGKFQLASVCKGPKACKVDGNSIDCDDSFGDVGDVCRVGAGDANYGCSTDKKMETVCKPTGSGDAADGKFEEYNGCRGTKGCWLEPQGSGNIVHCDLSFAREGDMCHPVDNLSCSEDAKTEMKCSPQLKWIKNRACKRDGCKIKGNSVYCD